MENDNPESSEDSLKRTAESPEIRDARFRGYFELPLMGIAIVSPNKKLIEANDRLCEMLGYARREFPIMTWGELTHPDHIASDLAQFDRLLAGQSDDFAADTRLICKNGETIQIGLSVGCVRKPDGAADYFVALFRDITHRKWADTELRNSVETIRALFNAITESLVLTDKYGTVLTTNATAARRIGRRTDEIIGRSLYDFFPSEITQSRMRYFLNVIETGKPVRFEDKRQDTWFDISAYPISDSQGNTAMLAIFACDITERKRTSESLKESEEQLRLVIENTHDIIFAIDRRYRLITFNQAFRNMARAVGGRGFEKGDMVLMPEYPKEILELWKDCYDRVFSGKLFSMESEVICPDGTHYFENAFSPIRDSDKNITGAVVFARDITERKKAEEAIKKHASDLMKKTKELEESNIALKVLLSQRERDKSEIEEKILRNVRESVLPKVEKLKAGLSDPRKKAIADIIESELNNLVSPFRHRLSSAQLRMTPQEIQVASLIKEGKDSKDIADILNISLTTLNFHRRNLRKKLGLTNKETNLRAYLSSLSE